MATLTIEMFSRTEMWVFGIAMLSFIGAVLILYGVITACEKLVRAKADKARAEHKVDRFYEVCRSDFTELGEAALRNQRMQSFIAETSTGVVEITVDEIIREVNERKCGRETK